MKHTKQYIYLIGKKFYHILPKNLRDKYHDDIKSYLHRVKSEEKIFFKLVNTPEALDANITSLLTIKSRTSNITGATIVDRENKKEKLQDLSEPVLDIEMSIFEEICVLGNTDALIRENLLYHQELLAMEDQHDLKRHDIFIKFDREQKNYVLVNATKISYLHQKNYIYITLLKEHTSNYYHWILENMPRLVLITTTLQKIENQHLLKDRKIILLIDQDIPKQCIEIINLIFPFNYSLHEIKKGELCNCKNLLYCSPFWQSLDNTSGKLNNKEFFIDKYGLEIFLKSINARLNNKSIHSNFMVDLNIIKNILKDLDI